jgi:hypothetical protein
MDEWGYGEPEKDEPLSDNDAHNEILQQLKEINKKASLFYYLAIIGIIATVISMIVYIRLNN